MEKPTVTVLSLGGTIAMTESADGGVVPTLTSDKLVAAVPELDDIATIDAQSFRQLPGAHLTYADLEDLADTIRALSTQKRRGFVITQGTDTIEETAFALDCLLDIDAPVIVIGAMRNPTAVGSDGPANLLAAVQTAICDEARGNGCLVVMNDEIHAARFVRKTHTSSPNAFRSPLCGRLGWVSEGQPHFCFKLDRKPGVPGSPTQANSRVALVTVALGDDGDQVRALKAATFNGIIVEATGGGHVPPDVAAAVEECTQKMPVILASRTGAGDTLARTYGFPGGEIDLQRRGLIRAGWLDGLKAKVLLTLLLRHGYSSREAITNAFHPWGGQSR